MRLHNISSSSPEPEAEHPQEDEALRRPDCAREGELTADAQGVPARSLPAPVGRGQGLRRVHRGELKPGGGHARRGAN